MPESKPSLSIIIVNYNDAGYLERCVFSISEKLANFSAWEIIIVNNDENQDIRSLPLVFEKIKVVNNKKNVGFSSGVNSGVKSARGKFLFVLNPDTLLLTENVSDVLEEFLKDQAVGVIGGGIIDSEKKRQKWSAGREVSLYNLFRNNLGLSRSASIWNSRKKTECDWVSGTNLFIRKDLFEKLGGFDENFFMYFEDMDLCRRARSLGKKIMFFPEFQVYHRGGESYADKNLQKVHYYDSMEKYFKKHFGWPSWAAIKLSRSFLRK